MHTQEMTVRCFQMRLTPFRRESSNTASPTAHLKHNPLGLLDRFSYIAYKLEKITSPISTFFDQYLKFISLLLLRWRENEVERGQAALASGIEALWNVSIQSISLENPRLSPGMGKASNQGSILSLFHRAKSDASFVHL